MAGARKTAASHAAMLCGGGEGVKIASVILRILILHCIRLLPILLALCIFARAEDAPPGKVQVEARTLKGDEASGVLRAEGAVQACFDGYTLHTEILEYNRTDDLLYVPQMFELQSPKHQLSGGSFEYHPKAQTGEVRDFDIFISEDGMRARGETLHLQQGEYSATAVEMSSCKPDARDWFLQAGNIQQKEDMILAQDVWFRVRDIPMFYLPQINIYTSDKKHSGFLFPQGEYSGTEGIKIGLPYYVFWKENADATLHPQWFSKHGLLLGGEARYLSSKYSGTAEVSWTPFEAKQRGRQKFSHLWQDSHWQFSAAADNVSDDAYFTDFSSDSDLLALRNLSRRAELSYSGDNWRGQVAMESFKTLDYNDAPPHDLLPQVQIFYDDSRGNYSWHSQWEYSRFVANNYVSNGVLRKQDEGGRWFWLGSLQRRIQLGNWLAHPEGGFHAAKYNHNSKAKFVTPYTRMRLESPYHPLAAAGSYQFRGMYAYAPQTKQNHELFDTALREFSSGGIYDWNRFSGGDRAADASVAAYGMYFRRQDTTTQREQLSLELAQRYNFRRPRVILPNESSPPARGFSNLFAALRARPNNHWKIEGNAEWDPEESAFESVYADVRADFGNRRLLRVGGLFEDNDSILLGGSFPIWSRADGAFDLNYLLDDDRITDSSAALEIRSECDCWRLYFRIDNVLTSESKNKKSYSIGFTLKGLGGVGGRGYDDIVTDLR